MRDRWAIRLIAVLALGARAASGQTAVAPPAFEVASVKPVVLDPAKLQAGQQHVGVTFDAARVDFGALAMADLIRTAYQVKAYQVSGPAWIDRERYDIVAKFPEGAKRSQLPQMLQTLLAERFGLQLHRSTKEIPAFALVVAKGGPRLKESPPDPDAPAEGAPAAFRSSTSLDSKGMVTNASPNGTVKQTTGPNGLHFDMARMTMAVLVEHLARLVDGPVADLTELKGKYDFVLDLSREELASAARASGQIVPGPGGGDAGRTALDTAPDPNAVSLRNSLEMLGLKLETRRQTVELLVIDHLEKVPIEN